MERPELKKTSTSLSYGISPDSAINNYEPKISQYEDNAIRKWVDETYGLYSNEYKEAAYKDAQKAVLDRKAKTETKAILERERKERAEKASYLGNNPILNQQKQAALAENAISDAAELIRKGQEANGVRVDKSLTDSEIVNKFLDANTEMPFAEYVNKFLDAQTGGGDATIYTNKRLAAKLGLAGKLDTAWVNTTDKIRSGAKGAAQGLADFTQNTIGRAAEWAGSNLGDLYGEMGYGAAKLLGADVSEGTVWDKMKKAKGYSWKEAKGEASSEDLWKQGLLSEDEGAFDLGRDLGQVASEVALTAPIGMGGTTAIAKSGLKPAVKWLLTAGEAFGEGLAFQGLDDVTEGELSNMKEYMTTGTLSMLTAGLFNGIGKMLGKTGAISKGKTKLFGAKGQTETALNNTSKLKWDEVTDLTKRRSKNRNTKKTPFTYIADKLDEAKGELLGSRVSAGQKLEKTRGFDLKYGPTKYTSQDVVEKDLNNALKSLSDTEKFGGLAAREEKIPVFKVEDGQLTVSNPELLNNIARADEKKGTVKLRDEIKQARDSTYGLGAELNEATTNKFLDKLDDILGKSRGGGDDLVKIMQDGIRSARSSFDNSLTKKSLKNLSKIEKNDKLAIMRDKAFDDYVGAIRRGDLDAIEAAQKAIGGEEAQAELFRQIKKEYKIDLNNEILMVAYNMSLYDMRKAMEFLQRIYPSKPGMLEAGLQFLTKNARIKAAEKQLRGNNVLKKATTRVGAKEAGQLGSELISTEAIND